MPVEPTAAPEVELSTAQRHAWERHLAAEWRSVIARNVKQHADAVQAVVETLPKPSLFNRRKDEVAAMVDGLLAMDLCWTADVIYPGVNPNPGWDHDRTVMVAQTTLYVGGQFNGQRSYRLTPEQAQRFETQGQRWAERRAQHFAQTPSASDLHGLNRQLKEAEALRQEMGRRPRATRRRRAGSSDMDSWNTPSSPVPNPYNGWGG